MRRQLAEQLRAFWQQAGWPVEVRAFADAGALLQQLAWPRPRKCAGRALAVF